MGEDVIKGIGDDPSFFRITTHPLHRVSFPCSSLPICKDCPIETLQNRVHTQVYMLRILVSHVHDMFYFFDTFCNEGRQILNIYTCVWPLF